MSGADFEFGLWLSALPLLWFAATFTWLVSLPLRNVGIVDASWSLLLFAAAVVYALGSDPRAPRLSPVLWLAAIWAARLAWHRISGVSRGEPPRYAALRARHPRFFAVKSLYLAFWPSALCAWLVSLPLMGAFASIRPWGMLDFLGIASWLAGFAWQVVAQWQLRRFKADPANADAVLSVGPWRFSRHPALFGDWLVWLGFSCLALAAGAWWALASTALMTWLLLRASGTGGNERPHYADYVLKTNAFFPGPPRN